MIAINTADNVTEATNIISICHTQTAMENQSAGNFEYIFEKFFLPICSFYKNIPPDLSTSHLIHFVSVLITFIMPETGFSDAKIQNYLHHVVQKLLTWPLVLNIPVGK